MRTSKEELRRDKIYSLGMHLYNKKYGSVFKQANWKIFPSIFLTQNFQRIIVWHVLYLVVYRQGPTISCVSPGFNWHREKPLK